MALKQDYLPYRTRTELSGIWGFNDVTSLETHALKTENPFDVFKRFNDRLDAIEDRARSISTGEPSPESQLEKIRYLQSEGMTLDEARLFLWLILNEPDEQGIIGLID